MKSILRTGNEVNDNGNVKWDEDSLLITEAQKNSTMKITEPKTPYIHYDHEKDIIKGHTAEIPPLELSQAMDQIELERKTGNRAVNDDAAKDVWDKEEEEEEIEKTKGNHFIGTV